MNQALITHLELPADFGVLAAMGGTRVGSRRIHLEPGIDPDTG